MKCPVCSSEETKDIERYRDFTLYHCRDCELQFWHPLKCPGSEWYESKSSVVTNIWPTGRLTKKNKYFLRRNFIPGGRLLDIGCGSGIFLKACRNRGYKPAGIDFDQNVISSAAELTGLSDLYALSFEEYVKKFPDNKFDIISFFEVLEHQDSPLAFITEIKNHLLPGGCIVLSVPDRDRWTLLKKLDDFPPEHLTRWNLVAIRNFLERNGFSVIELTAVPFSIEAGRLYFTHILMTFLKSKSSAACVLQNMKKKAATSKRRGYKFIYTLWRFAATFPAAIMVFHAFLCNKKESTIYCLAKLREN